MTDPNYVDPAEYARWETERKATNAEDDERQREAQQRADLARLDSLLDRITDLEVRLYLVTECFAAALERGRLERAALRLIVLEYEPTALRTGDGCRNT